MGDVVWGAGDGSPMNEGSEDTAVPPGRLGERRAGESTGQDARGGGSSEDALPWGADEAAHRGPAEQGGQPDLSPDPPVAGRRPAVSPTATDDSPGTPPGRSTAG